MNARRAKQLRRKAYGDLSLKNARRYVLTEQGEVRLHAEDPRAYYQQLKGHNRGGKPLRNTREIRSFVYLTKAEERRERQAVNQAITLFNLRKRPGMTKEQQTGLMATLLARFLPRRTM